MATLLVVTLRCSGAIYALIMAANSVNAKRKEIHESGVKHLEGDTLTKEKSISYHPLQSCHHHQSLQLSGRPLSLHQSVL